MIQLIIKKRMTGRLYVQNVMTEYGLCHDYYEVIDPFTARFIRRERTISRFVNGWWEYDTKNLFGVWYGKG